MELNRLSTELEKTLNDNLKLYDEMGKALDEEFEALRTASLPRLDTAIKRKMALAARLRLLEETRSAMVLKIAENMDIPPADMTLKLLADKMGGATRTSLLSLRSRMNEVVRKVTEKNEFNKGFIEKLMSLNSALATNLRDLLNPESTYEKGGFTPVAAFKPGQVVSRTY